jgi:transposase InsO family protein
MEFYERIKNQTGKLIKVLRTDQGREYEGERLATWKKQKGIIHQTTNHYTPQQNGVSERSNPRQHPSVF